jgi:hypothetical protein
MVRRVGALLLVVLVSWSRPSPATDPMKPSEKACGAMLAAPAVTVTPGCWVDDKVSNRTAALTYPCGGGPASAPFGVDFVGTIDAEGRVDLAATTSFGWGDGCQWQSEQRIRGTLSEGSLAYSYKEKPVSGKHCAPAHCVASAKVAVQPK